MRFLILSLLFITSICSAAEDEYLLVLASQRNSETIAEAARLFYIAHPKQKQLAIKARSDVQLWELSPEERSALINNSRAILGFGLYGASVPNLKSLLTQFKKPKLLINSDHRLVILSQFGNSPLFPDAEQMREIAKNQPGENFLQDLAEQIQQYPNKEIWLQTRGYWKAGGANNSAEMFASIFSALGENIKFNAPVPTPELRWVINNSFYNQLTHTELSKLNQQPVVAIIDHAGGARPADTKLLREICDLATTQYNNQCLGAIAAWGKAGVDAIKQLVPIKDRLSAVIMLQDFVIGGGDGRSEVTELLTQLNVPVIKAIKLRDRTAIERQLSSDGLAQDKVYYQVAMPELQGASQPLVIATAGNASNDPLTGIRVQGVTAETSSIHSLLTRAQRWNQLQTKENVDKKVAIIYYNHPPGRHNIGADNLDVPASLWQILNQLKAAGYNTGELPKSQEDLLDMMQARGVNLPRDSGALASMSQHIERMTSAEYSAWFKTLPASVRREMEQGPFGLLHEQLTAAISQNKGKLASDALHHTVEEMHHLLEGVDHKGRTRALALLGQLETCYLNVIKTPEQQTCMSDAPKIIDALQKTGIEGLGGWGKAPGKVMTFNDELLLPGLTFGNIFIGPQPPRGWEINEELLHANLAFPPPHQYLAFYHFLRNKFKADAFVHLGRHSTYEFLPRRSVGLAPDDYSRIIAGDVPGVYPYIVDGVGEGIQAKRRGLAVMVDHLTPPLASTPLYDELLQLRQLIESFETSHGTDNEVLAKRLVKQIREKVDKLELKEELAQAMSAELAVMGISFEEVDDDMMVHEVGHYLTDLQERFMPLGLHIFGKDWQENAVEMMLNSMLTRADSQDSVLKKDITARLVASPKAEMTALLNGLKGGFITPGQGNDPIRSPASLPTGRNFYALDSSLIPSRVAWQLGQEMAKSARENNEKAADKREALILWASDVVRDEGVMIAFGLDMLGLEPVWNSRGLVKGLKRQDLQNQSDEAKRVRRDMVFTTSGLFRDLYGQQMLLLDKATLMAIDASADTIRTDYPALSLSLTNALEVLGKEAIGGNESLKINQVAANWVIQAKELLAAGFNAKDAGISASLRVFGDAPGSYGAGINRLVERSGAWEKREELAKVYTRRLGHSYGLSSFGTPAQNTFKRVLRDVENTYFGRSSNLYGLIDNNDAFDYLGGLSLAVETLTGKPPKNYIIDHADPDNVKTKRLGPALRQELRGRFLNPAWLKAQMEHDYAGARTMGSEFLEYLWGWQVTNPTLVGDWAWEEVKAVYIDDRYDLQLDQFLEKGHNAHVKSNMLAIMLVAVQKDFWDADKATIEQLAASFVRLVKANGLPGSGHSDPDNPMLPWLEQHLSAEQWQDLAQVIALAKGNDTQVEPEEVHRVAELKLKAEELAPENADSDKTTDTNTASAEQKPADETAESETENNSTWQWWLALILVAFILFGFYRGVTKAKSLTHRSSTGEQ
ncbi:cobaltochelatase subunit CobN [Colwellia sp. RE-S-Sl-9]